MFKRALDTFYLPPDLMLDIPTRGRKKGISIPLQPLTTICAPFLALQSIVFVKSLDPLSETADLLASLIARKKGIRRD